MLPIPTSDFPQPTGIPPEIEHNIKLEILCDWIEGSVLFDEEDLSTTDVVDTLIKEEIYDDQDLATQIVDWAWRKLQRRLSWIGAGSPFSFTGRRMIHMRSWEEDPAHSFCILLSMPQCYTDWSTSLCGVGQSGQGRLFESLTKASIENQFSDWEVYHAGWSASNPMKLPQVVDEVANRLGEEKKNIAPWENPEGNDAGLDLLCYRPFPDNRVGIPVYLMQCASGKNWKFKLNEPDLNTWTKMIDFVASPRKAFAIPFALTDDEFNSRCNVVDGMLLDRYRLLGAGRYNTEWVPDRLKDEIIDWVIPRLETLSLNY